MHDDQSQITRRDRYTHGYSESVLRSHATRSAATCFAYGLPHLRPDMTILDVGCGPGTITADIARLVAPGRAIGVDLEPAVLDQARQHAAELGVTNIDFQLGDGYALDFPDESFDLTHAHMVLHHVTDPVAVLAEMRRVTRPGGIVAAREPDIPIITWYPENPGLDEWRRLFAESIRANGSEPASGRHLLAWAHQAGLTDVTASSSNWTYAAGESADWLSQSWADRMLHSDMADQLVEEGLATREDLQSVARAWIDWAQHPDAWMIMPGAEILAVR